MYGTSRRRLPWDFASFTPRPHCVALLHRQARRFQRSCPEHTSCDESSRRKFKPGVLYYSWPLAHCQYIRFICLKSWLSNCVLMFDICRCPLTVMRYMRMYCGWSSSILYANGAGLWREQYPQKPTFGVVGVRYNNIIYPLPMLYTWSP